MVKISMIDGRIFKSIFAVLVIFAFIFSALNVYSATIKRKSICTISTINNNKTTTLLSDTTLYVDDDAELGGDGSIEHPFKTVNEAIKHAKEGDTIFVFKGIYKENVMINKSYITLTGEDKENTIIQYNSSQDSNFTIFIEGKHVKISNFTIKGAKKIGCIRVGTYSNVINNIISDGSNGILIQYIKGEGWKHHVNITKNIIRNNGIGIKVTCGRWSTTMYCHCVITDNVITRNSKGILLDDTVKDVIQDNIISNNTECGIRMDDAHKDVIQDNIISNNPVGIQGVFAFHIKILYNQLFDNANGVEFVYLLYSTIKGNNISYNSNVGLYLQTCGHNLIEGNNISHHQQGDAAGICLYYDDPAFHSGYNTVKGNNISYNKCGIDIYSSKHNTIKENKISYNDVGITIEEALYNTYRLKKDNIFINNRRDIIIGGIPFDQPILKLFEAIVALFKRLFPYL